MLYEKHMSKRMNNKFSVKEDVVTVFCTTGHFICDLDDWQNHKHLTWHLDVGGYAYSKILSKMVKGKRTQSNLLFHKSITGYKVCDHINRIRHDNRKLNLRLATRTENGQNKSVQSNSKSGYKGVYAYGNKTKWSAAIKVNGKHVKINSFPTKYEAALAYNMLAKHYFGDFAYLNPVYFI